MLDQRYEPQFARLSRLRQETANDQVQWHAHINFVAWVTAMEQVPPPLQTYTQATVALQLQARQRNYVSQYGLPLSVRKRHAKAAFGLEPL